MKKNDVKIILLVCIIVILIIGVCIIISNHNTSQTPITPPIEAENSLSITPSTETGTYNNVDVVIKDYTIKINSSKIGHPSSNSYFSTSFTITHTDGSTYNYIVNFADIILSSENANLKPNFEIFDQGNITINNKDFKYYIDHSAWNSLLYYTLPDKKGTLVIELRGSNIFSADGVQVKTLARINKEVLSSKELAGILNFSVNK